MINFHILGRSAVFFIKKAVDMNLRFGKITKNEENPLTFPLYSATICSITEKQRRELVAQLPPKESSRLVRGAGKVLCEALPEPRTERDPPVGCAGRRPLQRQGVNSTHKARPVRAARSKVVPRRRFSLSSLCRSAGDGGAFLYPFPHSTLCKPV